MAQTADEFLDTYAPQSADAFLSKYQPSDPNSFMSKLAAPMDTASRGGAQLISNIAAPFLSEESRQKLRDAGLYDVKHPEIENPFTRGVAESPLGAYNQATYGAIAAPVQPVAEAAVNMAKKAGVSQGTIDNIGMAGNILGLAGPINPTAKTPIISDATFDSIKKSAGELFGDNSSGGPHVATPKDIPLTAENLHDLASHAFDSVEQQGGFIPGNDVDKFLNKAQTVLPQTKQAQGLFGDSKTTTLVERMQDLKGKPMTLRAAQEIDSGLGDMIDDQIDKVTGRVSKEGYKMMQLQNHWREMVDSSNAPGAATWKEARDLWATSMRASDIERIINRASMMDNPVTGIKVGFRNLAMNIAKNGGRGYTEAEIAAIKNAANTGFISNVLRTGGSKLISSMVGAMGGGPVGAGIGYGLSRPLSAAADAIQNQKANQVLRLLSSRPAVADYGQ